MNRNQCKNVQWIQVTQKKITEFFQFKKTDHFIRVGGHRSYFFWSTANSKSSFTYQAKGFIKFARGYNDKCALFLYSNYPDLQLTGQIHTTPANKYAKYNYGEDDDDKLEPQPDPDCEDHVSDCRQIHCYFKSTIET